jgi:hypothetical protein
MSAEYVAARTLLRQLWHTCPEWRLRDYAQATGRSVSWVKTWLRRFRANPDNPDIIWDRPRIHPPRDTFAPEVIEQILAIRDDPPEQLQRTPGPRAILYYLPRADLPPGTRLPRSTRTVWQILRAHDRIVSPPERRRQPLERPVPLAEVQIDFKDIGTAMGDADKKHAHHVEVFDAIDVGTSLWLMAEPSTEYTAETIFVPLMRLLERIGPPETVRFDRDPRFVGSAGMRDFPTPFVRFWHALGIRPIMNPPQSPELNAFVERLHRTVEQEYVARQRPGSLEATRESLPRFQGHYNEARPHQGPTCGNRPPQTAYPTLPDRPSLPAEVDPDRWLAVYDGRAFARRVKPGGTIVLDDKSYYVSSKLAGQQVLAQLQATGPGVLIWHQQRLVRLLPLKGLVGHLMPLDAFVVWCEQEARALWRTYLRRRALARVA